MIKKKKKRASKEEAVASRPEGDYGMEQVCEWDGPVRTPRSYSTAVRDERNLKWKRFKEKRKTLFSDTVVAPLGRPSRHVQKAAVCVSQEARRSQDRNVVFVYIWIKEFIKKLDAQGKETQRLIPGGGVG